MDVLFEVYPNMREHTGDGLSMDRDFFINASTKQKLNTRNSTEIEIVGNDNFIPFFLLDEIFFENSRI